MAARKAKADAHALPAWWPRDCTCKHPHARHHHDRQTGAVTVCLHGRIDGNRPCDCTEYTPGEVAA